MILDWEKRFRNRWLSGTFDLDDSAPLVAVVALHTTCGNRVIQAMEHDAERWYVYSQSSCFDRICGRSWPGRSSRCVHHQDGRRGGNGEMAGALVIDDEAFSGSGFA